MDSKFRNRWQIRLAVVIIFAIGFLAGGLAMNIYHNTQAGPPRGGAGMRPGFDSVISRLDLTEEQESQVRSIFDDARSQLREIRKESEPRFLEVRKQTDERLKGVLTPEQWEQFQQMKSEFREKRPNGRGRRDRDRRQ
ncbi:MAG TPA: periplasmic heavy metal sensor [Blastocatellia bacterium]|nr:periplasmic heavy metal sensor [Blastocatellia bacterium]